MERLSTAKVRSPIPNSAHRRPPSPQICHPCLRPPVSGLLSPSLILDSPERIGSLTPGGRQKPAGALYDPTVSLAFKQKIVQR